MRLTDCMDMKSPTTASTPTPIDTAVFLLPLESSTKRAPGATVEAPAGCWGSPQAVPFQ
ncbi:hypothetical protein I553_0553 [Mycobacterium xenopi 4042]|uniref:Uncharacterized protein n=1 Tax=Mycobacterium xenopi 4042 TaxID=1299334 RepID=X7YJR5_MYCXE|nr:hypothetical protein I553_0553 [Mycobacterium xenopi 4042]